MSLDPVLVEEVEVGHRSAVEAEVEVPGPLQPHCLCCRSHSGSHHRRHHSQMLGPLQLLLC